MPSAWCRSGRRSSKHCTTSSLQVTTEDLVAQAQSRAAAEEEAARLAFLDDQAGVLHVRRVSARGARDVGPMPLVGTWVHPTGGRQVIADVLVP